LAGEPRSGCYAGDAGSGPRLSCLAACHASRRTIRAGQPPLQEARAEFYAAREALGVVRIQSRDASALLEWLRPEVKHGDFSHGKLQRYTMRENSSAKLWPSRSRFEPDPLLIPQMGIRRLRTRCVFNELLARVLHTADTARARSTGYADIAVSARERLVGRPSSALCNRQEQANLA
jgi:hypothetical protein